MERPSPAPPPLVSARERALSARDRNAPAFRCVLNGVIQEIQNHATEQRLIRLDGRLRGVIEIERDIFSQRQRSGRVHALGNKLIEIKIAELKRILPGIRAAEREKILDDVREPLGLLVKDAQRFAIFLRRAPLLRESDLRLAP